MSASERTRCLEGKVAVVTGASCGIGAGAAIHLARAGAKVVLAARRLEKLQSVKESIEKEGGQAYAFQADVLDREQMGDLIACAETTYGPVDILLNNAGVIYYTHMTSLAEDKWEQMVDVNCKGVLNGIGAVLKGMKERKSGHIINISSDSGRKPFVGLSVYSGTKYFVEGMSAGLRQEVKEYGIRVTNIQPGDVKTEYLNYNTDEEAVKEFATPTDEPILSTDDIGRAVVYAASQPAHCAVNEILVEPTKFPL